MRADDDERELTQTRLERVERHIAETERHLVDLRHVRDHLRSELGLAPIEEPTT